MGLAAALLLAVLASAATSVAAEPDYDAIAENLVHQSLGIQPGEVVLVTGNPDQIDLMGAIQVAIFKAGGQPIITLNLPEANKRSVVETPTEHLERLPTAGLLLNRIVDATINVGSIQDPDLFADVPEERLAALRTSAAPLNPIISNMSTRNVSLGQTGGIPTAAYAESVGADYGEVREIFWQSVAVPPEQLAASAAMARGMLKSGSEVRIISEAGSELTFTVDELPARINAGRASDVASATGPSSVWLPAGEAYACVKPGSASGKLVVPHFQFRGVAVENLELTFKGGRLSELSADSNADIVREYLDSISDAAKELSLVDIGLNPQSRTPDGSQLYSWEMGGMVTVGLGNNGWAGGDNHADGALSVHAPGQTVTVNGETVVSNGKLRK